MKGKRFISLMLMLCLLGALWVPAGAEAEAAQWYVDEPEDAWTAETAATVPTAANGRQALRAAAAPSSGSCGDSASWTLDGEGVLTISGSGAIRNAPDFGDKSRIRAVVIEEGISSIGSTAFYACQRLRRVTLPRSITQVGRNAFYNCFFLTEVIYAGTLAEWEAVSFSGNSGLGTALVRCSDGEAGLPQLPAPTELCWGLSYSVEGGAPTSWDGMMSWANSMDSRSQRRYRVLLCDAETDEVLAAETWKSGGEPGGFVSSILFLSVAERGGTYAFTVSDLGDGVDCRSSEPVVSAPWVYEAPEEALPAVTELSWSRMAEGGLLAGWSNAEDGAADGFLIEFFYAATRNGTPQRISRQWSFTEGTDRRVLSASTLKSVGEGYYLFRVRAMSKSITTRRSADWTALSEPIWYGDLEARLAAILAELGTGSDPEARAKAVEAVRGLDGPYLAELMAADTANSGVTAKLAELEYRCGRRAAIEAEEKLAADMDPGRVTAIGAGLNGEAVTLRLGLPSRRYVPSKSQVPLLYFSVSLWEKDGEKPLISDGEPLKVPVKLTVPVSVGPGARPILLRQLPGGGLEEVPSSVFMLADGPRASFVLTEPGEFLLARPWYPGVELDLSGDGALTPLDAAALFARLSAGQTAPDVNGDGGVNGRDTLLLFRRTLGG